ncbi:MAG: YezD family protein [Candidatus Hydrogenedentes bacterium]|nr:YezD family protein [Candidatus Hydrogenedentota bacterium]
MSKKVQGTVDGEESTALDDETAARVLAAIRSLRYGAVEVTVHDSRVVQIDKKERIRVGRS